MLSPSVTLLALVCDRLGVEPRRTHASLVLSILVDPAFPEFWREQFTRYIPGRTVEEYPGEFSRDLMEDLDDAARDVTWRTRRIHNNLLPSIDTYRESASFDVLTRRYRLQPTLPFSYSP